MRSLNAALDRLAEATPPSRARVPDLLRLFSICVVVVWHWTLSINYFRDGVLAMPNPIARVPLAWLATWLLQVMPLFFVVGGFANLAAWDAVRGRAGGTWPFLRARLRRLGIPVLVFVAVWAVADGLLLLAVPAYPGLLGYGRNVLVPLWFLAAYLWVILLVPVTATLHRRMGPGFLLLLGLAVLAADVLRFGADLSAFGYVNTALVWVFIHQLGYFWRDGSWRDGRRRWLPAACGLACLTVMVTVGGYPRSMVATEGAELSNMYPTTAAVAALGLFQLGVVLLVSPALERLLARRRAWKTVVAGNAVIMTVFLWHMTALLLAMVTFDALGLPVYTEPTAAWWAQRPLWLVVPALFLAPLLALFAPVERAAAAGGRPAGDPRARHPENP